MGVSLQADEKSLTEIADRFERHGWTMAESNKRQALLPVGAEALPNAQGTAPGIAAKLGRCNVYVLPGVPREMRWMLSEHVLPRLLDGTAAIVHTSVHTFGMGRVGRWR